MQQQLVQLVSERTGLSEEKSRTAVDTVVGWIKQQLPGGMGSQLDNVVSGGSAAGGTGTDSGGVAGALGGMLGGERK
jgi:hypothetical protein